MREGAAAPEALAALLAEDPGRDVRQVGMVDAAGRAAAYTGRAASARPGMSTGEGVSIQANMMERPTVWPAMATAYAATLPGPCRSSIACSRRSARRRPRAATCAGGSPPRFFRARRRTGLGTTIDLRVDDHRTPLDELERLARLARAYELFDEPRSR